MKILIDMNLSPVWVEFFLAVGVAAEHWRDIGDPTAPDSEIFAYAAKTEAIVFTNDLDFGTLLAQTESCKPSVIQARCRDLTPRALGGAVMAAIVQFKKELQLGAILTISPDRTKIRILPLSGI
jgi:predicted nuclease of predicted toxin-antitoxin system